MQYETDNCSLLVTYKLFKQSIYQEPYLDILMNKQVRSTMACFRISAHNLHIERGRYNNTDVKLRSCHICNTDAVEDEMHFLTQCPAYNVARYNLFQKIESLCKNFAHLNNEMKMTWLLSAETPEVVKATAHFLHESFMLRNNILGIR